MYFLAKNLRACSRSLFTKGPSGLPHRLHNYIIASNNRAPYTSSCVHPEQMKRLIKERDANMLCRFFDSEEYKSKVSRFLETQSKLLSKETVSKIQEPHQVKIQHVLSCARLNTPKKKTKIRKQTEEQKTDGGEEIKTSAPIKKAGKTTAFEKIIQNKFKDANIKYEIAADTATIETVPVKKKVRTKTTIMPIFLKKMKHKNLKNAEEEGEETKSDDVSERNLDPHSTSVLHRSSLSSRGLRTMPQKKQSKISTTLIPKKQAKSMNLKSYSQLLVTKPINDTVYNMNSASCVLTKKRDGIVPPKVEIVKTKISDRNAPWPPKSSKRIENVNLQKYTLDMLMSEIQKTEKNDNLERKNTIKMILNNTVKTAKPKLRELAFCNLFEQVKLGTMKKQKSPIHTLPKYTHTQAKSKVKNVESKKQEKENYQTAQESFTYKIVSRVKKCKEKELKAAFEARSYRNQDRSFLKGSIRSEGSAGRQSEVDSTKAVIVSNLTRKPFIGNIVTSRRVQPAHICGFHTSLRF